MSGVFIVIEGVDGSGKTTLARVLAEVIAASGLPTCSTAEPSTGPVGALIRRFLRREVDLAPDVVARLFAADRADHVHRVIGPAVARGDVVVCDRYVTSSLVYHDEVSPVFVTRLNEDFPAPDLELFLDVAPEVAEARLRARGSLDRFDAGLVDRVKRYRHFRPVAAVVLDASLPARDVAAHALVEVCRRVPLIDRAARTQRDALRGGDA